MSSVVISGDTSGTCTLQAPAVAGSTVLTLPAVTGTVMVNGPAFSADASAAQTVSSAAYVKVAFNTEAFDTNSNYDTALYRFTPTVAGYYQVNADISYTGGTPYSTTYMGVWFAKNGTRDIASIIPISAFATPSVSALIYFNGSTDYIETQMSQTSGVSLSLRGTHFSAFLARGA
jgi:hypothetical protein